MKLFKNNDYTKPTKDDLLRYEQIRESEKIHPHVEGILGETRINKFRKYPKSMRHNIKLFPNNYLDIVELQDHEIINKVVKEFEVLLNKSPTECEVLSFINDNEHYLIIASVITRYNFGHHDAFLFKEFPLGTEYRADYLLAGKGSGGYEFVFIELESPSSNPFKKDGTELSRIYQDGINQVKSWERFLNSNYSSLQAKFKGAARNDEALPEEFINNDPTRRHYVVVAGRRAHYETNPNHSYGIRRQEEASNLRLLHYDNLVDFTKRMAGNQSF